MNYDIFISYRREGGAEMARTIKSELELQGFRVFLDFDELKDGVFDQRIINAIESAPIFMMILSPHALDRCVNEDDWVRREIECAIANKRHFVPVDPNRSFTGFAPTLPDSIKQGVGLHQFSEIMMGQLFKESVAKMVRERIRPTLDARGVSGEQVPSGVGALIHIDTDLDCRIFRFGKEIAVARQGEDTLIRLIRGKHKLEFVSLANEADRLSMLYPVPENEYEDVLTVELLAVKQQREAQEQAERDCIAREKAEQERIACEKREKAEAERVAKEKAEKERIAREKAEQERIAREKREKAEAERVAREQAEFERIAREKAENERRVKEKAEALRIAQMLKGKGIDGIYRAGDYYDDGTKQGVVFEVSDGGKHGKIVSLTQSEQQWALDKTFGLLFNRQNPRKFRVGAGDERNGLTNQRKIMAIDDWREKYPAFAWCADQGEGWYLPAIEELKTLLLDDAVHDAVNRTLEATGATKLYNKGKMEWYWSSTEMGEFCAWFVYMYGGYTYNRNKTTYGYVRAVSAF